MLRLTFYFIADLPKKTVIPKKLYQLVATASMHEAKDKLSEASDKANTVTKAIEAYIGKVKDITVKAKVDDADMEQAINNRKKLIENESKLLEDHRKKNKEILTRHFYDLSNMMSRNEGVWLSNGWVKTLLWIFLLCFLYTVISIVYFAASYIDKIEQEVNTNHRYLSPTRFRTLFHSSGLEYIFFSW